MNFVDGSIYLSVKDGVYFLIALAGVIIAGCGLSTWRRQLKGGVEHEMARRLYKTVLKVRDAMSYVRNPFISLGEMQAAETKYKQRQADNPDPVTYSLQKDTNKAVYSVRWEKVIEAISELQLEQIEAEVLWGTDVTEKLKPIKSCVTDLQIALSRFLNSSLQTKSPEAIEEIIYETRGEAPRDKFTLRIDVAIDVIANFLKPKY